MGNFLPDVLLSRSEWWTFRWGCRLAAAGWNGDWAKLERWVRKRVYPDPSDSEDELVFPSRIEVIHFTHGSWRPVGDSGLSIDVGDLSEEDLVAEVRRTLETHLESIRAAGRTQVALGLRAYALQAASAEDGVEPQFMERPYDAAGMADSSFTFQGASLPTPAPAKAPEPPRPSRTPSALDWVAMGLGGAAEEGELEEDSEDEYGEADDEEEDEGHRFIEDTISRGSSTAPLKPIEQMTLNMVRSSRKSPVGIALATMLQVISHESENRKATEQLLLQTVFENNRAQNNMVVAAMQQVERTVEKLGEMGRSQEEAKRAAEVMEARMALVRVEEQNKALAEKLARAEARSNAEAQAAKRNRQLARRAVMEAEKRRQANSKKKPRAAGGGKGSGEQEMMLSLMEMIRERLDGGKKEEPKPQKQPKERPAAPRYPPGYAPPPWAAGAPMRVEEWAAAQEDPGEEEEEAEDDEGAGPNKLDMLQKLRATAPEDLATAVRFLNPEQRSGMLRALAESDEGLAEEMRLELGAHLGGDDDEPLSPDLADLRYDPDDGYNFEEDVDEDADDRDDDTDDGEE